MKMLQCYVAMAVSLTGKQDSVCLFVCLFGVFVPLENFSPIWRRHHYR